MPGKNKPKRLNRQRSWRVTRRKKRISKLVDGNSRNRAPRPKKKKAVAAPTKQRVPLEGKKVVEAVKKVVKKVAKKVVKKEE